MPHWRGVVIIPGQWCSGGSSLRQSCFEIFLRCRRTACSVVDRTSRAIGMLRKIYASSSSLDQTTCSMPPSACSYFFMICMLLALLQRRKRRKVDAGPDAVENKTCPLGVGPCALVFRMPDRVRPGEKVMESRTGSSLVFPTWYGTKIGTCTPYPMLCARGDKHFGLRNPQWTAWSHANLSL